MTTLLKLCWSPFGLATLMHCLFGHLSMRSRITFLSNLSYTSTSDRSEQTGQALLLPMEAHDPVIGLSLFLLWTIVFHHCGNTDHGNTQQQLQLWSQITMGPSRKHIIPASNTNLQHKRLPAALDVYHRNVNAIFYLKKLGTIHTYSFKIQQSLRSGQASSSLTGTTKSSIYLLTQASGRCFQQGAVN